MTRLRVLFGTIAPEMPGGIHVTEAAFHQACEASGEIEVRTMPFGRRRRDEGALAGIVRTALDLVAYAWRIASDRPHVVHLDSAYDRRALLRDVGYAWLSRLFGQPLFIKFHGSDDALLESGAALWRLLTRWTIGSASAIGVLSTAERDAFVAAGLPAERIHVVKNAVDWRRFEAARWPRPGFDASEGGAREARLLFIARMVPGKGLTDVIRAVRHLLDAGRAVTLTCVGDGPARAEAEALARSLGVDHVVRFTGHVPEKDAAVHYLESSMLVFPTRREGFSMTVFQSIAAGLPVLTTRVRAAADHLRDPEHCLWVEYGDPQGLARRVEWLLDHPEVAGRMHAAARVRARDFDAAAVAAEYVQVYRRIARGGGTKGA